MMDVITNDLLNICNPHCQQCCAVGHSIISPSLHSHNSALWIQPDQFWPSFISPEIANCSVDRWPRFEETLLSPLWLNNETVHRFESGLNGGYATTYNNVKKLACKSNHLLWLHLLAATPCPGSKLQRESVRTPTVLAAARTPLLGLEGR